jgi:hypothetical protein
VLLARRGRDFLRQALEPTPPPARQPHSPVALQEAIKRFVEEHNRDPRPFVRTADPDAIVKMVRRGYHTLAAGGPSARPGRGAAMVKKRS